MKINLSILLCLFSVTSGAASYTALPVPTSVRVLSSAPRKIVWEGLSLQERNLAEHLLAAGRAGRMIIFNQNHRYGLTIKKVLERALSKENMASTKKLLGTNGFQEFLNYSAKFEDLLGPYEVSNRKYVLSVVTPKQVDNLVKTYAKKLPRKDRLEAVKLLTDPHFEVISQPEDAAGTDLENAGGNLYEHGLTGKEVADAIKGGLDSTLNCRIVRAANGKPTCEKQALNNPNLQPVVRTVLVNIVSELTKALPFALSEHQRNQIQYLIKYFNEGDVEDFRKMNIEWVRDGTSSKVDFMMGYVEVYADYLNQIGSWESYVQIVDPKTTAMSVNLAKGAQGFENDMPYGQFKKTFPQNYSPPALMVYYFQESATFHSGGYNLPNFDDIRRDVGAKNIIRLELPGQDKDPATLKARKEVYQEFLQASKVDRAADDFMKWRRSLVLLHEIIGHGSGTYDTTKYGVKEDPIGALGSLGSALEEQRADLTALVFAADPKLVKAGLYADDTEALRVREAMYDAYLATFLQSVSKQRSLTEAHQRGHWLLINKLLKNGAVAKMAKDGGSNFTDADFVLGVVDYQKFHQTSYELLAELQRIKAVRDDAELKRLFEEEAPLKEIEKPWLQAVIARGKKLVANNGAIEQPWAIENLDVKVYGSGHDTETIESIAPHYRRMGSN